MARRRKTDVTPWGWIAAGAAALALFIAFCNWVVRFNPHCRTSDCVSMFERQIQTHKTEQPQAHPGDPDWSPESIRKTVESIPTSLNPEQHRSAEPKHPAKP